MISVQAGRRSCARSWMTSGARRNWSQLDERARSRLLRLAASLALRDQDVERASALSAEADAIAPQEEPRLAAHVALERDGPAAALTVLGEVETLAGLQLRVALRTMSGDLEAVPARSRRASGEETRRIRRRSAWRRSSHLHRAIRRPALGHMRRVEALAPDWTAVLQLGAMARYACALSPALVPRVLPIAQRVRHRVRARGCGEPGAPRRGVGALLDRLVDAEPDPVHPPGLAARRALEQARRATQSQRGGCRPPRPVGPRSRSRRVVLDARVGRRSCGRARRR